METSRREALAVLAQKCNEERAMPANAPLAWPGNLLQNGGFALSGAVAGGVLVYLLTRGPVAAIHIPPIVFESIAVEGRTAPAGIWETRQTIVCPEPAAAPPPSPASPPPQAHATPATPKSDPRPRLLTRAALQALERGDLETAKSYAEQIEGPFRQDVDAAIARAMSR